MKKVSLQQGITLVELLVVLAVGSFVALAIYQFAFTTLSSGDDFQGRLELLNDTRKILRPMAGVIRQAQDSSVGGYAIQAVATDTLTVFSDIIDNGYRERVRFYLDGDELKRAVLTPSGQPLTYDPVDEVEEVLMRNVTDLLFRYYDQAYRGTGSALIHPFPTSDVRMVEVVVTIDDDPSQEPNPLGEVNMFVQLRNLKEEE